MKYEYFSLSLISFICGLLLIPCGIYTVSIPFIFNFIWYTYSFFFIIGFVLFGLFIWHFCSVLCFGFCFGNGIISHLGNSYVTVSSIESRYNTPKSLNLKYNKINELTTGNAIKFSCFFYGNHGKLLKIYNVKTKSPGFIDRIREYIKSKIQISSQSEFLYAMLLGDRSHMINQDVLKTNGIIHVFALSGLHISIILFYVRFFIRNLLNLSFFISYNCNVILISNIVAILFSGLYAIISFASASTLRSLIMCVLSILIPYIDSKKSLIITIFVMLIFYPNYILDQSFQMSCLATFAILSTINNIFTQQIFINATMIPFTNIISPLSIGLNFIMIPMISIALILSIIAIHFPFTLKILDYFIQLIMHIMTIKLPYFSIYMSNITKTFYYILIALSIYLNKIIILLFIFLIVLIQNIINFL